MTSEASRVSDAPWLPVARPILLALGAAEGTTRVVGGAVRDALRGVSRESVDIDMATQLLPEAVTQRAQAAGFAVYPTGIAHGTVTVVAAGIRAEVTTLREDIVNDGRHAVVRFGTDWATDAARRDFTMNALYCDAEGVVFDPLGGLEDCLAGRVRFVGEPDRRIAEDRLRVLRYFRFVATHGNAQCEPEALAACARAAGTLDSLSGERIGQEMLKLLGAPRVAKTLRAMNDAGLFPDIGLDPATLDDLDVMDAAGLNPGVVARLAVLAGDRAAVVRLQERWRLSNRMADDAAEILVRLSLAAHSYWNRLRLRAGDDALGIATLARALGLVGNEEWGLIATFVSQGHPGPMPVGGDDLIAAGMEPGPAVGEMLAWLEDVWVRSSFTLDREALLERLHEEQPAP